MCGIAGFIGQSVGSEALGQTVERMCAAMVHRGPDDMGLQVLDGAAFGMRRLAIFDPKHGKQPMQSPDGRYILIFNGAIYNHLELRRELAGLGHTFHTECDTEVLLAAYIQWQMSCLHKLRGMFAFAVWDTYERRLLVARDAMGVKPLYYARYPKGGLLFASELRALKASGQLSCEIDPAAIGEYLAWSAIPAPRTIYIGCSALRPGNWLSCDQSGQIQTGAWWSFPELASQENKRNIPSDEDFRRELRFRLEEVAQLYTRSDVPLGAFLSGGLDSTACVGLVKHAKPTQQLKTFSVVFDETDFSEESAAQITAKTFGTEHHELRLTGKRLAEDLPQILNCFDQPGGDGINTYYASLAAKQGGVTVSISGLGGDELFGGYPSFKEVPRLSRLLPYWQKLPAKLRNSIISRLKARGSTRAQLLADWLANAVDIHDLASLRRRSLPENTRKELLNPQALLHAERLPLVDHLPQELTGADDFQIISAWELRTYTSDILLRDSDTFSMAHSLELRVPLLDPSLVEWVWQQPTALKYRQGHTKWGLAQATQDLVPQSVLKRKKQGFTLPFSHWMQGVLKPFMEECFSLSTLKNCPWLEVDPTQKLWHNFIRGNDSRGWSRIWSLSMLISFCQRESQITSPPKRYCILLVFLHAIMEQGEVCGLF